MHQYHRAHKNCNNINVLSKCKKKENKRMNPKGTSLCSKQCSLLAPPGPCPIHLMKSPGPAQGIRDSHIPSPPTTEVSKAPLYKTASLDRAQHQRSFFWRRRPPGTSPWVSKPNPNLYSFARTPPPSHSGSLRPHTSTQRPSSASQVCSDPGPTAAPPQVCTHFLSCLHTFTNTLS